MIDQSKLPRQETQTETTNYGLPLWQASDVTNWQEQLSNAFDKIDTVMYQLQTMMTGYNDTAAKLQTLFDQQSKINTDLQRTAEENNTALKNLSIAVDKNTDAITNNGQAILSLQQEDESVKIQMDTMQDDIGAISDMVGTKYLGAKYLGVITRTDTYEYEMVAVPGGFCIRYLNKTYISNALFTSIYINGESLNKLKDYLNINTDLDGYRGILTTGNEADKTYGAKGSNLSITNSEISFVIGTESGKSVSANTYFYVMCQLYDGGKVWTGETL